MCFFSSHSFWTSSSLDVPTGVTQEEGHTGFLIHLLSAVRAFIHFCFTTSPGFFAVQSIRCVFGFHPTCLKKNLNAPRRPSEHPPVKGENFCDGRMSKGQSLKPPKSRISTSKTSNKVLLLVLISLFTSNANNARRRVTHITTTSFNTEMSRLTRDGTAEPVSRDQILRHARGQGNVHFPCSP